MTGNQDGSRAIQRSFNRRKLFQKLATHRRQGHTALPNGVHIRFNQPEYVEFAGEGEIAVVDLFQEARRFLERSGPQAKQVLRQRNGVRDESGNHRSSAIDMNDRRTNSQSRDGCNDLRFQIAIDEVFGSSTGQPHTECIGSNLQTKGEIGQTLQSLRLETAQFALLKTSRSKERFTQACFVDKGRTHRPAGPCFGIHA